MCINCILVQTIPAYGHGTVKVSFQPSIEALNELGDQLTSYANGYISLDEEVSDKAKCEIDEQN